MLNQNHTNLSELISFVFNAHTLHPKKPSKAFRKWDGQTPYATHAVWCAMTILTEETLPEDIRSNGAQTLLLHDVLEDTTTKLPEGLTEEVIWMVEEMTFTSSAEEMVLIWSKSPKIRLLKLYDKVSNLLDGSWMDVEKIEKYREYVKQLAVDVEKHFGLLNIVRIAKGL